jgi:hypothetical protein
MARLSLGRRNPSSLFASLAFIDIFRQTLEERPAKQDLRLEGKDLASSKTLFKRSGPLTFNRLRQLIGRHIMKRKFDPITLEILWRRLISIVDESDSTVARTAFSSLLRDAHDYTCMFTDQKGRELAQGTFATPGQSGAMALGITTAAAVRPAKISARSQSFWYARNHPMQGISPP